MRKSKLLKKFNLIASKWLSELEKMDESKIQINPALDSWSIAEVYDHIIRVARSYQIPNFKRSTSDKLIRKKRKNIIGIALFNLGIRRYSPFRLQNFPAKLVKDFTPTKRSKSELITDFKSFIQEVNELEDILLNASKKNKHYHPMFGDITTSDWFSLIEIHMWHHDFQRKKVLEFLFSAKSCGRIRNAK